MDKSLHRALVECLEERQAFIERLLAEIVKLNKIIEQLKKGGDNE